MRLQIETNFFGHKIETLGIATPNRPMCGSSSLDNLTSSDFLRRSTEVEKGKNKFSLIGARRRKSSMPTKIRQKES